MLKIELSSQPVLEALRQLIERIQTPDMALREIGEDLAESTKERFRNTLAPDGEAWTPNTQTTIDMYARMFASSGAKKPLVGETRRLASEISWQLVGDQAVEIGSSLPYANMQQWGGTKAQWPHLWGDIPARPFLGISEEDEQNILAIIGDYLLPE